MPDQSILERLQEEHKELLESPVGSASETETEKAWIQERLRLQNNFIDLLDISIFRDVRTDDIDMELRSHVSEYVSKNLSAEFSEQVDQMTEEIQDQLGGLGPLKTLIHEKTISEIMVNGTDSVYIEKNGHIQESSIRFQSEKHVRIIIEQIASGIGRHIDKKSPMLDARLSDGSRVNAIIPPAAPRGSTITIRRFLHNQMNPQDLVKLGTASNEMLSFLESTVKGSLNIVISGRTGSGKTTFLNVISSFIPMNERLVTIEDAAEISLQQQHVISLESVPPDRNGENEVTIRDLVKNSLRMRPDRIIVGECRGNEAFDMLQAMNTGHDGSMTTVHANSPRDALNRIESLFVMAGYDIPNKVIRHHITSAIDLIVQIDRLPDGSRRVTNITEITGMEEDVITMQDIYDLEWRMDVAGNIVAHHRCKGIRPKCAEKLALRGFPLPNFDESSNMAATMEKPIDVQKFSFGDDALLRNR